MSSPPSGRSGTGRVSPYRKVPPFSGPVTGRSPDRLTVVRLRFALPPETPHNPVRLRPFLQVHPQLEVWITAVQNLPNGLCLTEIEVVDPGAVDWTEEISHIPGIVSASIRGSSGPISRYQVTTAQPIWERLANEFEALLRYPRLIQNCEYTVEVAAPKSRLNQLVERLRQVSPSVQVLRFGREVMRSFPPTLTPRQQLLLHQALSAGYFDVPRRITLTGLATKLGRSKSGLSRALAVVERELAESSVAAMA